VLADQFRRPLISSFMRKGDRIPPYDILTSDYCRAQSIEQNLFHC